MISIRTGLDHFSARYSYSLQQVKAERGALREAREQVENVQAAQKIVQQVAEAIQNQCHRQISSVVSRCLETVFGDPYQFKIQFEQKRNKTEAKLLLVKGDLVLEDPLNEAGGGVCDLCSFALRLACLLLSRPRKRRFLALDEPFKHLSKDLRSKIGEMLEALARELKLQILMVTHDPALQVGNVIEIS